MRAVRTQPRVDGGAFVKAKARGMETVTAPLTTQQLSKVTAHGAYKRESIIRSHGLLLAHHLLLLRHLLFCNSQALSVFPSPKVSSKSNNPKVQ